MSAKERAAGVDIERLIPRDQDPPADPVAILIYVREVDGVQRTCARFPSGTVIMIL